MYAIVIRVDYSKFRTAKEMAVMVKREYLALTNIRTVHWDDSSVSAAAKDENNKETE